MVYKIRYMEEIKRTDNEKKLSVNSSIKYVNKTDYTLKFEFVINGKIQKNDLMGAIYNHGSHILEDLTLERLQVMRKLGRFVINLVHTEQGTTGDITVPIIADKIEAAIVAANLQTIDKCGPFSQKIRLKQVINERAESINKILASAKRIYETKFKASVSSISQLRNMLKTNIQNTKYVLLDEQANIFGGPYHSRDQIYLVQGLNDVKKLIQHNIYNTISVNGGEFNINKLKPIVDGKQITLLFDQDRGGKMLSEQIIKLLDITYVVKIPENMCVQSLPKDVLFESIYNNKKLVNG